MDNQRAVEEVERELRRIGLDAGELAGLATDGPGLGALLAHLRRLPPGSSWADVFPDAPAVSSPSSSAPEPALGPFDYPDPPRGIAVFASLELADPLGTGEAAIARARQLGVPVFGAGVVLDRGHPHLYIVLTREATEDDAVRVADALRGKGGVSNAFPIVRDGGDHDA